MGASEARNAAAVALSNALRGVSASGFMAFFSAYMSRLGYSLAEIGAVVTLSNVLGAAVSPLVGYLLDVYGSRIVVALTGFVSAASLAVLAFSRDLAALALSYALFHLAFYFAQPARMAFLARTVDRRRLGTVVGLTTTAFTASRAVGPAVGGYLIGVYGYGSTFLLLAAVAASSSLVFLALSREPEVRAGNRGASLAEAYRRALRPDRRLAVLYLFASLDRAAWNLWHPMLSAHLIGLGYGEASVGALLSAANVVEAVATPVAGKLTDRFGSSTVLALSEVTAALAALTLINPASTSMALASMVSMGLSISFWIPGYNVYVAKVFRNVGETFASVNAVRSVVSVPAPYLGGLMYGALSPLAPFALSAAMLSAATFLAAANLREIENSGS